MTATPIGVSSGAVIALAVVRAAVDNRRPPGSIVFVVFGFATRGGTLGSRHSTPPWPKGLVIHK